MSSDTDGECNGSSTSSEVRPNTQHKRNHHTANLSALLDTAQLQILALENTRQTLARFEHKFAGFGELVEVGKACRAQIESVESLSEAEAKDLLRIYLRRFAEADQQQAELLLETKRLRQRLSDVNASTRQANDIFSSIHETVTAAIDVFRKRENELSTRAATADNAAAEVLQREKKLQSQLKEARGEMQRITQEHADLFAQQQTERHNHRILEENNAKLYSEFQSLREQLSNQKQRLDEAIRREREARAESYARAQDVESARRDAEDRVAAVSRDANQKLKREILAENEATQALKRDFEKKLEKAERAREQAELQAEAERQTAEMERRKASKWERTYNQKIREHEMKLQAKVANGYRDILVDIADGRQEGGAEGRNGRSRVLREAITHSLAGPSFNRTD